MDFSDLIKAWLNFQLYPSFSSGDVTPPRVNDLTALISHRH